MSSPDAPALPYDPANEAPFKVWRQTTTPRTWLQFSVIWYSRWLTERLGAARLQRHIDQIGYGNRDLSGDPGRGNALTHAWLGSSLRISPSEQALFLIRLLKRDLGFSDNAHRQIETSIQQFRAKELANPVFGKTGTVWVTGDNGQRAQLGWFVGWVPSEGGPIVFVRLQAEADPQNGSAGNRSRAAVLDHVAGWIGQAKAGN